MWVTSCLCKDSWRCHLYEKEIILSSRINIEKESRETELIWSTLGL